MHKLEWTERTKHRLVSVPILVMLYCNHGDSFYRLKKFEIMMILSSSQFYCVSLCQERKSIQLDIIMDKSTKDSAQHRKELLEFFQSTMEEIRLEFMAAATKPVCYIPCPYCSSLHIRLTNLPKIKEGVQLCNTRIIPEEYYQDLYNETQGLSASPVTIKYYYSCYPHRH